MGQTVDERKDGDTYTLGTGRSYRRLVAGRRYVVTTDRATLENPKGSLHGGWTYEQRRLARGDVVVYLRQRGAWGSDAGREPVFRLEHPDEALAYEGAFEPATMWCDVPAEALEPLPPELPGPEADEAVPLYCKEPGAWCDGSFPERED